MARHDCIFDDDGVIIPERAFVDPVKRLRHEGRMSGLTEARDHFATMVPGGMMLTLDQVAHLIQRLIRAEEDKYQRGD